MFFMGISYITLLLTQLDLFVHKFLPSPQTIVHCHPNLNTDCEQLKIICKGNWRALLAVE